MTSKLTLIPPPKLNQNSVEIATEILNRSLVGLFEQSRVSISRFQRYFNWTTYGHTEKCLDRLIQIKIEEMPKLGEDSPEWEILNDSNSFDLQLYEIAKDIFDYQGKTIFVEKVSATVTPNLKH